MNTPPPAQKPGIIRRGQKKPYHKATQQEVERRVNAADAMISKGLTPTEIHRMFARPELGGVSWRMAEIYIARARKRSLDAINRPRQELIADEYKTLQEVKHDKSATPGDRVRASVAITDLLGLAAPKMVRNELSGPGGAPLQIQPVPKPEINWKELEQVQRDMLGLPPKNGEGDVKEIEQAIKIESTNQ